jgi:cardiolipin synthase (CMP-forming)
LIPLRVTVLVFGRDVIILVVTTLLYVTVGMRDFRPSVFGKANTLAQIVAVATVLIIAGFGAAPWLMAVRHWLIEAVVILTTLSAFHYVWLVSVRLREMNQSRHKGLHAA